MESQDSYNYSKAKILYIYFNLKKTYATVTQVEDSTLRGEENKLGNGYIA